MKLRTKILLGGIGLLGSGILIPVQAAIRSGLIIAGVLCVAGYFVLKAEEEGQ